MPVPYEQLNVRHNPFGELTEAERAELAVVDIDDACDFLRRPHSAVQCLGEKGFGKTTHLLAIRLRFKEAGYVHIPEGERAAVPDGSPILVDEAQRLTWRQRRRVFPESRPLVLGTHRDFESALRRAGRNVRTIQVHQSTTADRIYELLNRRIEHARRSSLPVPSIRPATVQQLQERFGSDVRAMLGWMYERFETLDHIQEI
ncbi:MAG: hypothetical protein Fues2KO_49380 [Fuerstiella sp.]